MGFSDAWGGVAADPGDEVFVGEVAGGHGEGGDGCFGVARVEVKVVLGQEEFHGDVGGALVAVDVWMVAGDGDGIGGGEGGDVRLAIDGKVLWPGERAFEQTGVSQAGGAAVFGELDVVDGVDPAAVQPIWAGHLLRQFTQDGAALFHDAAGFGHVGLEGRVGWGEAHAVRGLDDVKGIALGEAETGQHFLGQDDADRVANGGELEGGHGRDSVATYVIMRVKDGEQRVWRVRSRWAIRGMM